MEPLLPYQSKSSTILITVEKTLVLDLDETLVHCAGEKSKGAEADVFVNIILSSTSSVEVSFF